MSAAFEAASPPAQPEARPGRTCPTAYRYSPRAFDREPDLEAETLYVVGGVYGNVEALEAVLDMAAREAHAAQVVFNGDFHWFDVEPRDFSRVNATVLAHAALRGNVETEIAGEDSGAGCGCAYPVDVSDDDVERSNAILARLRSTASAFPVAREALSRLPMLRVARVGGARVGVVHGDCASLAGWGFAAGALDNPAHGRWLEAGFAQAQVDIFASSHTCLPAMRAFAFAKGTGVVANNGAAGMPNFEGTRFGLVTRISAHPSPAQALYGLRCAGAFVDALPVRFDHAAFERRFLASWPEGSAAHASYHRRIAAGPAGHPASAAPRGP